MGTLISVVVGLSTIYLVKRREAHRCELERIFLRLRANLTQ